MEGLAQRRSVRPFDRLIIETTGLADVAVPLSLLQDPDDPLAEDFVFDAVITVVDAAAFQQWAKAPSGGPPVAWVSGFGGGGRAPAAEAAAAATDQQRAEATTQIHQPGDAGKEARVPSPLLSAFLLPSREVARSTFWKQIAFADQLVISKRDLIKDDDLQGLLAALFAVNPLAQVSIDAGISPEPLPPPLCKGGDVGRAAKARAGMPPLPPRKMSTQKRRRSETHLAGNVSALVLRPPAMRPLRKAMLRSLAEEWLAAGLQASVASAAAEEGERGWGDIWRLKGFLLVEQEGWVLLQGVGDQVSLEPWPHSPEEHKQPFLVVIGEELEHRHLEESLATCAVEAVQAQLGA